MTPYGLQKALTISIHTLREEGDFRYIALCPPAV